MIMSIGTFGWWAAYMRDPSQMGMTLYYTTPFHRSLDYSEHFPAFWTGIGDKEPQPSPALECDVEAIRSEVAAKYMAAQSTPSDIGEHIPVIYEYVRQNAQHATELGVRHVVSSWAFLKAGMDRMAERGSTQPPFVYMASDIKRTAAVDELDRLGSACPQLVQYQFVEGNDLVIGPWETEVLLIDTWHAYRQLVAELRRWAPHVSKYILLHDTESFGESDEADEAAQGSVLMNSAQASGLWQAVEEFLVAQPEWVLHERRRNNNGLTVLRKTAEPKPPEQKQQRGLVAASVPVPKFKTEVVMFIPTPVPWAHRRAQVHAQFAKEGWTDAQVVLLFVVGTLQEEEEASRQAIVSNLEPYASAKYVPVPCYDEGDRFDDPDDKSATTCKVYEALKHVAAHYEARFVWRGADDSYVNLPFFFKMAHTLPAERLFYGRLRQATGLHEDLQLARQPRLQALFGMHQFGQYMFGMGYLLSYDVADFVGSLKIPPHLTWYQYLIFCLVISVWQ
jgi:hypothetical protein